MNMFTTVSNRELFLLSVATGVLACVVYLSNMALGRVTAESPMLAISVGGTDLYVELARTPQKRETGLSGRASLPDGQGMLFIHATEDMYAYWMPDMRFSLDILWINSNMDIVHIEENVSPESYPMAYTSNSPALYVLEVPAGFVAEHDISLGQRVRLR